MLSENESVRDEIQRQTYDTFSQDQTIELDQDKQYEVLTYNQYLVKASGGFSQLQSLALLLIFVLKFQGYMIAANLGFLKMIPSFQCQLQGSDTWFKCTHRDICDNQNNLKDGVDFSIDWDNSHSLSNIITKFQLFCSPKLQIMLLGVSLIVGTSIYLIGFGKLLDQKGRRSVMIYSLGTMLVTLALMVALNTSLYIMYFYLCVYGVAAGALQTSSLIFCIEFIPKSYHSHAVIISNSGKAFALIFGCIYFQLTSSMLGLFLFHFAVSLLSLITIIKYFPESPKYYHMNRNFKKARALLNQISLKYRQKPLLAVFKEEEEDNLISISVTQHQQSTQQNEQSTKMIVAMTDNMGYKQTYDQGLFYQTLKSDLQFRVHFITIVICHAGSSFSFVFINLILPNLLGNIYLTSFLVGAFEMLAFALSGLLIKIFGVGSSIQMCYFLALLSLLAYFQNMTELVFGAICIALMMFGVAANTNITAYAAYIVTPPEISSMFFIVQGYITTFLVVFAPILAETKPEDAMYLFMWVLSICTLTSAFIQVKNNASND